MISKEAFSLLETLIVLAIIAIFAVTSLPLLQHFIDYNRSKMLQTELLNTLEFARQEAQIRHLPIGICKSNNNQNCAGDWIDGQLVFIDENKDGIVNDKKQVLSIIKTHLSQGLLRWRSFPMYRQGLLFLPTGRTRSDNGTFWYCSSMSVLPRWAIILNKSGRTRVAYPDQHGIIKDGEGSVLMC